MNVVHSQQVSWWEVHTFVSPWLEIVGSWPTLGTPAWSALPDGDPKKIAALCDAARHWALRLELGQEARADASKAVSAARDWKDFTSKMERRREIYIPQTETAL